MPSDTLKFTRRTYCTSKVAAAVDAKDLDRSPGLASVPYCAPGAVAAPAPLAAFVPRRDDRGNGLRTMNRLADAWESMEGKAGMEAFFAKRRVPGRPE